MGSHLPAHCLLYKPIKMIRNTKSTDTWISTLFLCLLALIVGAGYRRVQSQQVFSLSDEPTNQLEAALFFYMQPKPESAGRKTH